MPGIGPVERDEIVKGYEYEKGRYVTVGSNDLDKLRLEATDTIDISESARSNELDPVYFDKPYYLVPKGTLAEEGYRVIRRALHAERDGGDGASRHQRARTDRRDPASW